MKKKVIIDLGAHMGEDSDYYLRKGYRVIAVDASKRLCDYISDKFASHPQKEHFTILNYAIANEDNKEICFYENTDNSVWGTIYEDWVKRNEKLGTTSVRSSALSKRLDTIIAEQLHEDEEIEYIKIDLEGADLVALQSLSKLSKMPKYISIESEKLSWERLLDEFRTFKSLGYTKFKIIDQSRIEEQKCPNPAKEGEYIDYKFKFGSSGLFGEELPGEWLTEAEAIQRYKEIFKRYKYFGDYGIFNNKWVMKNRWVNKAMSIFKLSYPHVGWYDTHAALG